MRNIDNTTIKRLSPFLDLNFTCVASHSHYSYHAEAAWPVNIISFFPETSRSTVIRNVLDGEEIIPQAGWIMLIPCGLKTCFRVDDLSDISIHFNLTFCHGVDIFRGEKHLIQRRNPFLVKLAKKLVEGAGSIGDICKLKAETMRFCASIWPANAELRSSPAVMKYESVFRLVKEKCDASMTVSFLAETMKKRQDAFSREFSRDVGKTPKTFLLDELLKKTSMQLLLPGKSVREVAADLKFCSEFYMSSFFKKRTGMSPSEYQAKFRR